MRKVKRKNAIYFFEAFLQHILRNLLSLTVTFTKISMNLRFYRQSDGEEDNQEPVKLKISYHCNIVKLGQSYKVSCITLNLNRTSKNI